MQRLNDTNLKEALTGGAQRLYAVAGNDVFLADGCISAIVRAALGDSRDGLLRFGQKELRDGAFEELFYSFSMLGQNRVAVIDDMADGQLRADDKKLLDELLPQIPEDLTVVLRYCAADKRFSVPKWLQELAALQPDGALVTVSAKEGGQLLRYIGAIAKREGCAIEPAAERAIAALCGDELQLISSEIKKLAALCDYTTITTAHVEALGVRTAEAGVYKMLSAIEAGNTRQATALLRELLDDLSEPLSVTAVLNTAFINLYRARLVRDAGHTMQYMADHFGYKKGDRKVSIAFENCLRYPLATLERIIDMLWQLDRALKSSAVEPRFILEQRVIELASVIAA